jgi:hypothetical protein
MAAYGVVQLPFYATGFRGDDMEAALGKLAPISLRYRALRYEVIRFRDDRYRFQMNTEWDRKEDWDAFWFGEEFTDMRTSCSSWFTVPLLYAWADTVTVGHMRAEEALVGEEED